MNNIIKCFKENKKGMYGKCILLILISIVCFLILVLFILNIKLEQDVYSNLKTITLCQKDVIEYFIDEECGKLLRNSRLITNNPDIKLYSYLKTGCISSEDTLDYIILDENMNIIKSINNDIKDYKKLDLKFMEGISSSKIVISPVLYDNKTQKPIICIGTTLNYKNTHIKNYLVSIVYAQTLYATIKQDEKFNNVSFYLLNDNTITYSSKHINDDKKKYIYDNLTYNLETRMTYKLIKRAISYTNYEGNKVYGYITDIDDTTWKIVYEQEKKYAIYFRYQKIVDIIINNASDGIKQIIRYIEEI